MMNKNWMQIHTENIEKKTSSLYFESGISVFIQRPHILNRKLIAGGSTAWVVYDPVLYIDVLKLFEDGEFSSAVISKYFESKGEKVKLELNWLQILDDQQAYTCIVILRTLYPRNLHRFTEVQEAIVIDREQRHAAFFPRKYDVLSSSITPSFPFKLQLLEEGIALYAYKSSTETSKVDQLSEKWLKTSVLPKVVNWCQNLPKKACLSSLSLVYAVDYNESYHYLKTKYGKKFIKIWPERSDPLKYVYEDIAIAAYLISLWKHVGSSSDQKPSFIDLGCGNGLLVHILSSEGYPGIGIDVRKRKIWDLYGPQTTLIEKAVKPSDDLLFPEYDWIIGNHSDELTPWIPVIAARSSYKMKVFLLPCCPYTFNGKYDRSYPGCTQYESYLRFIHDLCKEMGFEVQQDKLRIPSTKRICFVCASRSYNTEEEAVIDRKRTDFINSNVKKHVKTSASFSISDHTSTSISDCHSLVLPKSESSCWISDFKPRDQHEAVRNCSNFDKKFVEDTVVTILNILLRSENFISLSNGALWNAGGQMNIADLVKLMDPSVLKRMKNHCGGFQTFLRNHKEIFQIENCVVQIRKPYCDTNVHETSRKKGKGHRMMKKLSLREKKCMFHFHHPHGCPVSENNCKFSHERD